MNTIFNVNLFLIIFNLSFESIIIFLNHNQGIHPMYICFKLSSLIAFKIT